MAASMMLHLHIVYLSLWINVICGQTLTDTKQLYTDVFANLQKEVDAGFHDIPPSLQFIFALPMTTIGSYVSSNLAILMR
jgi:hypothetical protein